MLNSQIIYNMCWWDEKENILNCCLMVALTITVTEIYTEKRLWSHDQMLSQNKSKINAKYNTRLLLKHYTFQCGRNLNFYNICSVNNKIKINWLSYRISFIFRPNSKLARLSWLSSEWPFLVLATGFLKRKKCPHFSLILISSLLRFFSCCYWKLRIMIT